MTRLVKKDVLSNLDFSNFGMYIDCIKGKQIKSQQKYATRSQEFLELMHIDICSYFTSYFGG